MKLTSCSNSLFLAFSDLGYTFIKHCSLPIEHIIFLLMGLAHA